MQNGLITGCTLASMIQDEGGYGLVEHAALAISEGTVIYAGTADSVPDHCQQLPLVDLEGRLVTPALIDCHTHLVFGGNRFNEFEMRLQGASYQQISSAGGGIASTVTATRNASDNELTRTALARLDHLLADGVGVVEIKSGYGLTVTDELRMLKIARHLETLRPVKIVTTWLAAHALPPDYTNQADRYIDEVVIKGLSQAAGEGLVDAVDGYCETIGFNVAQMARIFDAAGQLGLPVKLHAEQLTDSKGALLVAEHGGLSADHLEYLTPADVPIFSDSGAVAVLLPGAFYTLGETQKPPVSALRANSVEMAVATDCNPGTSPLSSLLTAMNMACTLFALTPAEALAGTTRCAARALGLDSEYGVIAPGRAAELAVWNVDHPAELSYWAGPSPLHQRIRQRLPS